MLAEVASHLDEKVRINLGVYYTKETFVDKVWRMIGSHLQSETIILDNSCGCGNFFRSEMPYRQIGNDIDSEAIENIKRTGIEFHNHNALFQVTRKQYEIDRTSHLCIIGNPPYNDRTSLIRRRIKNANPPIDKDLAARDLGMSFLLSYRKLKADVVCILHPLSWLIKPSNFRAIGSFAEDYRLTNAEIISSAVFSQSSKTMHFPIVIGLYLRSKQGTTYGDILNFPFKVKGGKCFRPGDFGTIANYVKKYPNRHQKPKDDDLLFWTIRDLNALKRNRTFVHNFSTSAIIIDKRQLDHYIYIDVIKRFSNHFPYYFGNCDVPIDERQFGRTRRHFIIEALSRHPHLRKHYSTYDISKGSVDFSRNEIKTYLQKLLGAHYVD